jgi:hypothetical protein
VILEGSGKAHFLFCCSHLWPRLFRRIQHPTFPVRTSRRPNSILFRCCQDTAVNTYQFGYRSCIGICHTTNLVDRRTLLHKLVIDGVADKIGCRSKPQLFEQPGSIRAHSLDAQFQSLRDL